MTAPVWSPGELAARQRTANRMKVDNLFAGRSVRFWAELLYGADWKHPHPCFDEVLAATGWPGNPEGTFSILFPTLDKVAHVSTDVVLHGLLVACECARLGVEPMFGSSPFQPDYGRLLGVRILERP